MDEQGITQRASLVMNKTIVQYKPLSFSSIAFF